MKLEISLDFIVSPDDPRVDEYIGKGSSIYPQDQVSVWEICGSNDRTTIPIGRIRGTYREAVAAMLSDHRSHYYAWGNGFVRLIHESEMNYSDYVQNLKLIKLKQLFDQQKKELDRRLGL